MSKTLRATLVIGGLLTLSATISLADERSVHIPAYHPPIGQQTTYRLYIEANVDTHGAVDGAGGVLKGDFLDRLAVISASPEGFKMRWRLEPCKKDAPDADPSICDVYREKLEAFGFDGIVVETNRKGAIQKIELLDDIKRNVESRIAALTNNRDPMLAKLTALQKELAADPLSPASVIAPPARLFADAQIDHEHDFELGAPQTKDDVAQVNGMRVPLKVTSLVTADFAARTATFTLTKTLDAAAYAAASQDTIRQSLTQLQEKSPDVTPNELAKFSRASWTVTSTAKVSLDDGSTLFAEEIVDNHIGPLYLKHVLRTTRE